MATIWNCHERSVDQCLVKSAKGLTDVEYYIKLNIIIIPQSPLFIFFYVMCADIYINIDTFLS